ncbi:Gp49 family protein [Vibrio metoecus]|uniref:Gp49 family protein n=1 Tax=Vibrio metoecus TaxID=1481663 RepID=UPI0013022FE7|nr:Gp49 family protein [Vibrio metoecus]
MTEKELTSVSKAHINTLLASLNFHFERIGQTTTTVCYAFLPNGFRVGHGDSACVNPANYDYAEGCKWAKENAIKSATQNLWMMEGYLLKVTGQTSDRLTIDAASTTPVDSDVLEGFKVYQGKAIKRTAYELQPTDVIIQLKQADSGGPCLSEVAIGGERYQFAHFEPVYAGDFICFLDAKDIYHVRRSVMEQRNYL